MSKQPTLKSIVKRLRLEDDRWDAILDLKLTHNPKWVTPLIKLLEDKDWVMRWCVAEKLGDMGDTRAIPALLVCVSDDDKHVRKNALKALKKFDTAMVKDAALLLSHPNLRTRALIFQQILDLNQAAVPELAKALKKADWIAANRIVHLIWRLGSIEAESILIKALDNQAVQKNVIVLLALLKSQLAVPKWIELYQHPRLKRVIIYGLKIIGKPITFPLIIDYFNRHPQNEQVKDIIKKIGPPILPQLKSSRLRNKANKAEAEVLIQLIEKLH